MSANVTALAIPSNWDDFRAVTRSPDVKLLQRLGDFRDSILVTGCQRSGTTMLAQILIESAGMVDYRFGADNELDAALILAGWVEHKSSGRHCFQTTFVNEKYSEYFEHAGRYKMIWVLRNPASVIHSMLYNWGAHTPDRLFYACGIQAMSPAYKLRHRLFGLSPLRRACWGYNGKTLQLFELHQRLEPSAFAIIDYDDLVIGKERLLPLLYDFLELEYRPEYAKKISSRSLNKKQRLGRWQQRVVHSLSTPIYKRARNLLTFQ